MLRILVTDGMDKDAAQQLRDMGNEVVEQYYEPEMLGEALQSFDVVVIRSKTKIRKPIIDEALKGKLKLIIRAGVGIDNIDHRYAEEKGIKVRNTPNSSSASVAELAIGHMFAVSRHIGIANVTMRDGKWEKKSYKGVELAGKTLGLVGFGRISKETAKRAEALGMNICYTDIIGKAEGYDNYEFCTLDALLQKSDYVSLHIPFIKEHGPTINKEKLELMKNTAFLINCARGGVVDEKALVQALNEGKLAGAAFDVFEEEPTKNIELVNHPKVCVTPHIGASTAEAQKRIGQETIAVIKEFAKK
ncbi:D-2-hydroxyacid dehydrogenase [Oceanirhabdus sp. W0125-5]|uniref:D-2-hydroxyacid dehydrogenase n=1 Tax=Oceanirhabdus sp. W0125-5 TaxID=2999116 RepID=UPI0022F30F55|nr:D-2-hydroxyacid dehydrogenase [Oceanirhabdus sp. W0125-5]WBW97545.1 D-2-hydroxyacid dehydrogenase [Oceanirhabdus sp. W0125-5]